MILQNIQFFTFSLFFFFKNINTQCDFLLNDESFCKACSYNYYYQGINDNSFGKFQTDQCLLRENVLVLKEIFVFSDSNCNTLCDGSLQNPYNDLGKALIDVSDYLNRYLKSEITIYLMSREYVVNEFSKKISLFRRINTAITIKPLYCETNNTYNNCIPQGEKPTVKWNTTNGYFLISNIIKIANISLELLSMLNTTLFTLGLFTIENLDAYRIQPSILIEDCKFKIYRKNTYKTLFMLDTNFSSLKLKNTEFFFNNDAIDLIGCYDNWIVDIIPLSQKSRNLNDLTIIFVSNIIESANNNLVSINLVKLNSLTNALLNFSENFINNSILSNSNIIKASCETLCLTYLIMMNNRIFNSKFGAAIDFVGKSPNMGNISFLNNTIASSVFNFFSITVYIGLQLKLNNFTSIRVDAIFLNMIKSSVSIVSSIFRHIFVDSDEGSFIFYPDNFEYSLDDIFFVDNKGIFLSTDTITIEFSILEYMNISVIKTKSALKTTVLTHVSLIFLKINNPIIELMNEKEFRLENCIFKGIEIINDLFLLRYTRNITISKTRFENLSGNTLINARSTNKSSIFINILIENSTFIEVRTTNNGAFINMFAFYIGNGWFVTIVDRFFYSISSVAEIIFFIGTEFTFSNNYIFDIVCDRFIYGDNPADMNTIIFSRNFLFLKQSKININFIEINPDLKLYNLIFYNNTIFGTFKPTRKSLFEFTNLKDLMFENNLVLNVSSEYGTVFFFGTTDFDSQMIIGNSLFVFTTGLRSSATLVISNKLMSQDSLEKKNILIYQCIFYYTFRKPSILLKSESALLITDSCFLNSNMALLQEQNTFLNLSFIVIFNSTNDLQDEVLTSGGSIYSDIGSLFQIYHSIILQSISGNSGGFLYGLEANVYLSQIIIKNTIADLGGIFFLEKSELKIENSIFQKNKALDRGGALVLKKSIFEAVSVVFFEVSSQTNGGVVDSYFSTITISDCLVLYSQTIQKDGLFFIVGNGDFSNLFNNTYFIRNKNTCVTGYDFNFEGYFSVFSQNNANYLFNFLSINKENVIKIFGFTFFNNFIQNSLLYMEQSLFLMNLSNFQNNQFGIYLIILHNCKSHLESIIFGRTDLLTNISYFILSNKCYLNIFKGNLVLISSNFFTLENGYYLNIELCSFVKIISSFFDSLHVEAFRESSLKFSNSHVEINNTSIMNEFGKKCNKIYAENSNLSIINTSFKNYYQDGGHESAPENSVVYDIYFEGSDDFSFLNILNSNCSLTNNYFLYLIKSASVIIFNTSIVGTSSVKDQGGFYFIDALNISIDKISIDRISGISNILLRTELKSSMLYIKNTKFNNCFSNSGGACINLDGRIYFNISQSVLKNAQSFGYGGAILFKCDEDLSCLFIVEESVEFTNNTAFYGGANIHCINKLFENSGKRVHDNSNNSLKFSSFPSEQIILPPQFLQNNTLEALDITDIANNLHPTTELTAVSGQNFEFIIVFLDFFKNICKFETNSFVEIVSQSDDSKNISFQRNREVFINEFYVHFKGLLIRGIPGTSYECYIKIVTIQRTYLLKLNVILRNCVAGELFVDNMCLKCPVGFYSLANPYEMNENDKICFKCPLNAVCIGGSTIFPVDGYFRYDQSTDLLIKCLISEACIHIKQPLEDNNTFSLCALGYKGPLYFNCAKGYGRLLTEKCVLCDEIEKKILKIFVLFIFTSIMLLQITSTFKAQEINSVVRTVDKILVNHLGFLDSFSIFIAYDTDYYSYFSFYTDTLTNYVTTAPEGVLYFDCYMADKYDSNDVFKYNLLIGLFFPVFYSIFLMIIKLVLDYIGELKCFRNKKIIFRKRSTLTTELPKLKLSFSKKVTQNYLSAIIIIIYNIYPKLLMNFFKLLKCVDSGIVTKSILEQNPEIECWTDDHKNLIYYIGIPNFLLWGIGLPLFVFIISRSKVNSTEPSNEIKSLLVEYFIIDYKEKFFYWEAFNFFKKMILVALIYSTDSLESISQGCLVILCFFLYLLIHEKFKPYAIKIINDLESFSYIACIITVAGIMLINSKELALSQYWVYLTIIAFTNTLFIFKWTLMKVSAILKENISLMDRILKFLQNFKIFKKFHEIFQESVINVDFHKRKSTTRIKAKPF